MAAESEASSGENIKCSLTEKNGTGKTINNNFVRKGNSQDLLNVCPERDLEKYLLVKNNRQVNVQRTTFKPPVSQVLRQVKDFLPKMRFAQEELSSKDLNIENVNEDGPCINMDIQLVELEDGDISSSESGSDCSDETTDNQSDIGEVNEHNLKLKKFEKFKKPLIEDIT